MLRKKPPGRLLSTTAHKVEREHRVISALYGYNQTLLKQQQQQQQQGGGGGDGGADRRTVPVPRPYVLCEDASVLGTPFYVMEFLDGRIIEDPYMASPDFSPAERAALWRAAANSASFRFFSWRAASARRSSSSSSSCSRESSATDSTDGSAARISSSERVRAGVLFLFLGGMVEGRDDDGTATDATRRSTDIT